MEKLKNPIHYREFIIAGAAILLMFIIGSVWDFQISDAAYDATNTSFFGIIMAGIAEVPAYLAIVFAGTSLIIARNKTSKVKQVFSIIVGVLAIVIATYFGVKTFYNISEFENTKGAALAVSILAHVIIIPLSVLTIIFTAIKGKKIQREVLWRVAIMLIVIIGCELILFTGVKYIWSRPRPRYVFFQEIGASDRFVNWWVINPFDCMSHDVADNFKSFPSGHSASSMVCIAIFPLMSLLSKGTRNDRRLQVGLFYAGLGWALLTSISRIYAGAHWLSDTAGGFLLSLIIVFVVFIIFFSPKREVAVTEETH